MRKTNYLIICILFFHLTANAANDKMKDIDSLKQVYTQSNNDSVKIRSLNFITHYFDGMDLADSSLFYIDKCLDLIETSNFKHFDSYPFVKSSQIYLRNSQYDQSLKILLRFLDVTQHIKKINHEGYALTLIVNLFDRMKDEKLGNEYAKLLEEVVIKMDNNRRISDACNALGNFYKNIKKNGKALTFHQKALKIRLKIEDNVGISYSYNNIGLVYKNLEKYDLALDYLKKSLHIKDSLNDLKGMAGSNINIAKVHLLKLDLDNGILYVNKGITLANEAKSLDFESNGYEVLYKIQKVKGNYKDALNALEQKHKIDSVLFNKETIDKTNNLEKKYNTEKQKQQLLILQKESKIDKLQLEQKESKLKIQQWIITVFIISFLLIIYIVYSLYKGKKQKQHINDQLQEKNKLIILQKEETEFQKKLLEVKNKEINETIDYAKGIQQSILPSASKISSYLNDYFILYKPKTTLAKDFYWSFKTNNTTYIALADCSGSSVSGALLSVVCSTLLSKVVKTEQITEPAQILNRTHQLLITHFEKSKLALESGMDIALVAIKREENGKERIEFAGANSPLIIIENGSTELQVIKGDKFSVGKSVDEVQFTNHVLNLNKKSILYLHTDGYPNQFGGDISNTNGKKLKSNNFYKMLETYHQYSLKEQNQFLLDAFTKWKGEYEQTDDVCVIGLRL